MALLWVFAVAAVIFSFLCVSALFLAFRHRYRIGRGVYEEILAIERSSRILWVLTVRDLMTDPLLRARVREELAGRSKVSENQRRSAKRDKS
jgi:hypothetical protein